MNELFGAYTQLAGECAVCPKVSTCDHKRMENLGYIIPVPDLSASIIPVPDLSVSIIPVPDLSVSIIAARANGKSLCQLEILDSLMKKEKQL